VEIVFDIAM